MLSLAARASCKRSTTATLKPLYRSFATEVAHVPASEVQAGASGAAWRKGKVPVREDHGLYAFFRRKEKGNETGEDAYETVESPRKEVSGRAWKASELRLKSFKDLHTLWYVTLRERNLLASQREEARKAGIKVNLVLQTALAGHCRKTMARIKVVMNERRLAYEGAVRLFAEHQELQQDKQLLKLQQDAFNKAQVELTEFQTKGRKLHRENQRKLEKMKAKLQAEGILPTPGAAAKDVEATEPAAATPVEEPVAAATPTSSSTPSEKVQKEEDAPTGTDPKSAVDTAAASLFGESVKPKQ